jgi:hypothetical protein
MTRVGSRLGGRPVPKAEKVLKVASRHSVLARKLSTSASVKGPPVLAAMAAAMHGWMIGGRLNKALRF